ncbi:MAG TPA: hypothetical protein VMF05_03380 [Stellaceae bacterium]|nr:hypothetical protein [Stellaceae bacterium]
MIDVDDRSTGNRERLAAVASRGTVARKLLIKAAFGLATMLVAGAATGRPAAAVERHDFRICTGYYALCAASTCTPTGKTITVNVASGGTAKFPEVECTCPIESGDAIADVDGGNMRGSCATPGPGTVWSLYSPKKEIPQAINQWVTTGPGAEAPLLYCAKEFNLGAQIANCFSFACNNERYINGVPVASCYCPLGESPSGTMVAPHTGFVTQAGQDNYEYCAAHPVAGPISTP